MTFEEAKRKAKFGHSDWITYVDRSGERVFTKASAETMKTAMLATGTQKGFTMICASDGVLMKMSWWIANNVRKQFMLGMR